MVQVDKIHAENNTNTEKYIIYTSLCVLRKCNKYNFENGNLFRIVGIKRFEKHQIKS